MVYMLVTLFNKSSQLVYVSTGPKEHLLEFARRGEPGNQHNNAIQNLNEIK
jgi:hypothetical protein